jgi:hypothetical protein
MNDLLFTGQNMGGICKIRILDVATTTAMADPINGIITTEVGDANDWEEFHVQDQQSDLTETEISSGGKMYGMSLTANIRKQSGTKSHLLYGLTKKRFLIDFEDNNGERRLAGTLDEGISIHIPRNETRRQGKEPNEYQVQFRAVRRFPIPFYAPA